MEDVSLSDIKKSAHKLIDQLPDDSSWDDLIYVMVVRKEIEQGLEDAKAGKLTPQDEVEKEFGIHR